MKKVYLVHCWGGDSNNPWFVWLKKELESRNVEVHAFDMPNSEHPKIEEWVNFLEEKISPSDLDSETYFVGHSVGCQTIMRFLEKLPKQEELGGCVFVSGWFKLINLDPEELEIAHPWVNSKISAERVLQHTKNILAIFSNNDPYVPESEQKIFRDDFRAKIIIKKDQKHFEETSEIPEILEFILKNRR